MKKPLVFVLGLLMGISQVSYSQKKSIKYNEDSSLKSINLSGLKCWFIGPSLTSRCILDIAVNPNNPFEYCMAASEQPNGALNSEVLAIEKQLNKFQVTHGSDCIKSRLDIDQSISLASHVGSIGYQQKYLTSAPT